MSKFSILHISDIHWSPNNQNDVKIVIDALIRDLNSLVRDGVKVDALIFSGDLVQSGADIKHFEKAYDSIILQAAKAVNLPKERIFMCPGNHDIDRSQVIDFIELGLKASLKNTSATNNFIDKVNTGNASAKSAFDRLKNYNVFMRTRIYKPPNVSTSPMVNLFKFNSSDMKIGISIFNTAWRCTGQPNDADRNFLVLGERNVDSAITELEDCDLKIAVFHHPTDWLCDFDSSSVLARLYSGFDLIAHGHIHKPLPEQRFTTSGTALISQVGCLYNSRDYPNSYQIVTLDTETEKATFRIRTFFDNPRREFDAAVNVAAGGTFQCDMQLQKKNSASSEIRKQLREVSMLIRGKAASHLDIGGVFSSSNVDAKTTFVCPPLSTRKYAVSSETQDEGVKRTDPQDEDILIEKILNGPDNVLFMSQREGGKTSLANHICVLTSEGSTDKDRIPVIVRHKFLQKGRNGIIEEFQSYYKSAGRKLDCGALIRSGNLLVIVDDLDLSDKGAKSLIAEVISVYSEVKFIFFANSSGLVGDSVKDELSKLLRLVYVKPLPRRAIREMSRRWCQVTGNDDAATNTYIIRQVRENNLPRTGYMISLLIWAYQKQKKMEKINEAYLLNAVIDHLLNKSDFTQALRKSFDPVSAEITLQEIAMFLRERDGICTTNDLLEYIVKFFRQKALNFNALEIMKQLEFCGILVQQGDTIHFKYKCFQEYFIAVRLKENDYYRMDIVKNHARGYAREIYLMSGLRRRNDDVIKEIRLRLENNIPADFKAVDVSSFTRIAKQKVFDPGTHKKLTALKTKKITSNQVDDLLDATEKELEDRNISNPKKDRDHRPETKSATKENEEENVSSLADFMDEVSLLGAIVKNSEFDDGDLKYKSLTYYFELAVKCLVHMTNVMEQIIDKFINSELEDAQKSGRVLSVEDKTLMQSKLLFVMQRIMAVIISLKMSQDVATEKLHMTYVDLISSQDVTPEIKLFISLIMYDINQTDWEQVLKSSIDLNDSHFMLDVTTERLWHDLHTRYEPETRREQISRVVDYISDKFGTDTNRRNTRQSVDKVSTITQARGRI